MQVSLKSSLKSWNLLSLGPSSFFQGDMKSEKVRAKIFMPLDRKHLDLEFKSTMMSCAPWTPFA